MSEDMIHFWNGETAETPCNIKILTTAYALGSPEWDEVTCGACKLERPLEMPREYRVPQHVKDTDARLTAEDAGKEQLFLADTLPRAALLHRRLAKAKAVEEMALECMSHWARTLAEAVRLREGVERDLSELLPGGQVPGVAQVGTEKILAQNRSQRVEHVHVGGRVIEETRRAVDIRPCCDAEPGQPHTGECTADLPWGICPGCGLRGCDSEAYRRSAVDIRTEPEYAEGMTNTENLSKAAQSALIEQHAFIGRPVDETGRELFEAGLIGPKGGLTRKGGIVRARIVRAREDAAFG